jgi:hypothetical protein
MVADPDINHGSGTLTYYGKFMQNQHKNDLNDDGKTSNTKEKTGFLPGDP